MTVQQCKYVLAIARTGSFSEAAKQLFVAQSGLSSSIKQLENELHIRIFERSKIGVVLSSDGAEFVKYAEQLVEQSDFILERYAKSCPRTRLYVSSQHYDFVADIFSSIVEELGSASYDLSLRELRTHEVIRDVEGAISDIGVIATRDRDYDTMARYLVGRGLVFTPLFEARPHAFLGKHHSLAGRDSLSYADLLPYPYVSYEQGAHSASLFREEIYTPTEAERTVLITDRATLMNVLISTDSYTVGTGIMPSRLNDGRVAHIPLADEDFYRIGYITRKDFALSSPASLFIDKLSTFATQYNTK